jgi:LysM repeat protein
MTVTQRSVCVLALSLLMTACASRFDQAPVVDRSGTGVLGTQGAPGSVAGQPPVPLGPPPPGYYRVKPGDTLYRIALENGQNYRDIASWNNLTNPNQIEVDQLLRVAPLGANVAALTPGVATAPIGGGAVQSAPLGSTAGAPGSPGAATGLTAGPPIYGAASNGSAGRERRRFGCGIQQYRVRVAGARPDARHLQRLDQQGRQYRRRGGRSGEGVGGWTGGLCRKRAAWIRQSHYHKT